MSLLATISYKNHLLIVHLSVFLLPYMPWCSGSHINSTWFFLIRSCNYIQSWRHFNYTSLVLMNISRRNALKCRFYCTSYCSTSQYFWLLWEELWSIKLGNGRLSDIGYLIITITSTNSTNLLSSAHFVRQNIIKKILAFSYA